MSFLDEVEILSIQEAATFLGNGIGAAAITSMEALAPNSTTELTHRMAVLWEWVALLLHLTNRMASEILGEARGMELMHLVSIPVINSAIDTFLKGDDSEKSAYAEDVVKNLLFRERWSMQDASQS